MGSARHHQMIQHSMRENRLAYVSSMFICYSAYEIMTSSYFAISWAYIFGCIVLNNSVAYIKQPKLLQNVGLLRHWWDNSPSLQSNLVLYDIFLHINIVLSNHHIPSSESTIRQAAHESSLRLYADVYTYMIHQLVKKPIESTGSHRIDFLRGQMTYCSNIGTHIWTSVRQTPVLGSILSMLS